MQDLHAEKKVLFGFLNEKMMVKRWGKCLLLQALV